MEIQGFKFFRVDDNEELLLETYRLRYEIYCHEAQFLDEKDFEDGIEKDIYDQYSIHFAALDKENRVVGTLRLVLVSELPFPLEEHCPNYDKTKLTFPRKNLAEISRLAVSKSYRRRKNDGLTGQESYHTSPENPIPDEIIKRRKRPAIVFGLYKEMYNESKRQGITHWYAAMEQKLNDTLRKFSFYFDAIGPEEDYYGPVTPFLAEIKNIEQRLYAEKPDVMHLMAWGLEAKYKPKLCRGFHIKNFFIVGAAKMVGKI